VELGPTGRHVHKHLWQLPIVEFDDRDALHKTLSDAGVRACEEAVQALEAPADRARAEGRGVSTRAARRHLREWLDRSELGRVIEDAVEELLAG